MTKILDKTVPIIGTENIDRSRNRHNLVYKMHNKINGKHYIGVHVTNDINDGYLGSGSVLRSAILLHGTKSFVKEILFDYPTEKEAYAKERELVTVDTTLPKDKMSYNVKPGGSGGYPHGKGENSSFHIFRKRNPEGYLKRIKQMAEIARRTHLGVKGYKRPEHSKRMSGKGNPMYGVNVESLMTQEAIETKRARMRVHAKGRVNMEQVRSDPVKYKAWKEKISLAKTDTTCSEETKKKHSALSSISRWWNNGTSESFSTVCPDGFVPGRLKMKDSHRLAISRGVRSAFSEINVKTRRETHGERILSKEILVTKLPETLIPY